MMAYLNGCKEIDLGTIHNIFVHQFRVVLVWRIFEIVLDQIQSIDFLCQILPIADDEQYSI